MLDFIPNKKYYAAKVEFTDAADMEPQKNVIFSIAPNMSAVMVYNPFYSRNYVYPLSSIFRFFDVTEYVEYDQYFEEDEEEMIEL